MFDLPRQYPVAVHVRVRARAHANVHVHYPLHVPVHVDAFACAVACVHGFPSLRSRCPDKLCAGVFFRDPDQFRAGVCF